MDEAYGIAQKFLLVIIASGPRLTLLPSQNPAWRSYNERKQNPPPPIGEGVLVSTHFIVHLEVFRQGLRDLG